MTESTMSQQVSALQDFQSARRHANLEVIWGLLRGKPADLLAFEEVRERLLGHVRPNRTRQDIPLDAIVGSVGRYEEFTRHFFPRRVVDEKRWANVQLRITEQGGLDPIEVYQIGDAYFVQDGNHRVSVARSLGAHAIEAYVTPVQTRVPFSAMDTPDDLIRKGQFTRFLERTRLDILRPASDLSTTLPGRYALLESQILAFQEEMGVTTQPGILAEVAVLAWHDDLYIPAIHHIHDTDLLDRFPDRTPTDLYVWLSQHRTRFRPEGTSAEQ